MISLDSDTVRTGPAPSGAVARRAVVALALSLAGWGAGCDGNASMVEHEDPEVLAVFEDDPVTAMAAAPDGTLFASTVTALWRAPAGRPRDWTRVAEMPAHPIGLHATGRGAVFFLVQLSGSVFEWREEVGVREVRTALTDSLIVRGHYTSGVPLMDVAGVAGGPVIAVGDRGAIVRSASPEWVVESTPLDSISRLPAPAWYRSALWWADGYGDRLYAASNSDLLVRENGAWRRIPLPEALTDSSVAIQAVAATAEGVLVAGAAPRKPPRLLLHDGRRWRDLSGRLAHWNRVLTDGRAQPDGGALLWSGGRYVLEVRGRSVRLHDVTVLGAIRGAARTPDGLFVGGTQQGSDGVVMSLTP